MRQSLNFNHLECFFNVARTLSFSTSAKDLGIAQPAISKQIKSLEEYFGQQLFIRNRQNVTLTTFGKETFEELAPLYNELCNRVALSLEEREGLNGSISVGSLDEVGEKVLLPFLSDFKKIHPSLKIDLQLQKSDSIISSVKDGSLDIGLVGTEVLLENMRCYEVFQEEVVLVTADKKAVKLSQSLSSLPFVSYRKGDPLLLAFLQKFSPNSKLGSLNIEFSVNSHKSMIEVLLESSFYAVLPKLSIRKELREKRLFPIKDFSLSSGLYLIVRESEFMEKKTEELTSFLREEFKKLRK